MTGELRLRRLNVLSPLWGARNAMRIAVLFALGWLALVSGVVIAEPVQMPPPQVQAASSLDELFHSTGVLTQVAGLSILLEDELRNLSASPLFSREDITKVRSLMTVLREDALYRQLQTRVEQTFTSQELAALYAWSQRPEIQTLLAEERALQKMPLREQVRLYRLRMKESQPAPARVEKMLALDKARYQTQFETALKVSLRKNLLSSVAVVKTRQALTEAALDKELADYRARVAEELTQHATTTYLYLFRATPTTAVQSLLSAYEDPMFLRFMAVCEQALETSFRVAREKGEESLRYAQAGAGT